MEQLPSIFERDPTPRKDDRPYHKGAKAAAEVNPFGFNSSRYHKKTGRLKTDQFRFNRFAQERLSRSFGGGEKPQHRRPLDRKLRAMSAQEQLQILHLTTD